MKKFKEWLKLREAGTGTNAIAVFSQPIGIGMVQREPVDMIGFRDEDHPEKKKKHKKKDKKRFRRKLWFRRYTDGTSQNGDDGQDD